MKLIPDWRNKNPRCHFCGETRSVKYEVVTLVKNEGLKKVYACNSCVLKRRKRIS